MGVGATWYLVVYSLVLRSLSSVVGELIRSRARHCAEMWRARA